MSRVETWSNVRTRIKCRIIPIKAKERVWMKREGELITHTMYARVEPGFSYRPRDRIVWSSRTLEIVGEVNEQEMDRLYEISLQEIK